ncbi:MAG: hypothetical protein Q9222_001019 [Ikaeria aurantiellina]
MPDDAQSIRIFNWVVSTCTFPSTAEIDDHTCHICQENTLGPGGSERLTKLGCGHTFGMSCLLDWTFARFRRDGETAMQCPICKTFFSTSPESETVGDEDLRRWTQNLATWNLGNSEEFDTNTIRTIRRAEELWANLCDAVLDTLDRKIVRSRDPLVNRIEDLLCGIGFLAQRILSFGSVYNFHVARSKQAYDLDWETQTGLQIQAPYSELIAHLRGMGKGDEDENWRVFQAFEGPESYQDSRRRLQSIRSALQDQIAEAHRSAA